jgi:hypothetical protein
VFRLQVWHEGRNGYVDVVLSFDAWGPLTFRSAQLGDRVAEYDDWKAAWRDVMGLQERHIHAIFTILDTSTGVRQLDWADCAGFEPEAEESVTPPKILTDDWIVQRAVRIRLESEGGNIYEPWPGYAQPMTRDQAFMALEVCKERWPDQEFRAHRVRFEERLTAEAIDRARRPARFGSPE